MRIDRPDVIRSLQQFVASGSGVLIGPPGVGKTFLLRDYCSRLIDEGGVCLYLPLDKLIGLSDDALRSELDISTDLPTFLQSQPIQEGGSPPVLVIDAFDSARSEFAQQFVLGLIRRVQEKLKNRWRLVVSVRTYDAKKSVTLQSLFPDSDRSSDPDFRDESIDCRHFLIPALSENEVAAAVASIAELPPVYDAASAQFKALMAIPFNLWLAESLLAAHTASTELTAVNSEVQLLSLYWSYRVDRTADFRERTSLLQRITSAMVEQRALSVRVADVYPPGGSDSFNNLLSSDILEEDHRPHRQRVSFSHNILFDYAVSVLLIEDAPEAVARFLSEDPSRPLFLRPSVDYFFTRLWLTAQAQFWIVFWHLLEAPEGHVRVYARLVPAMVIAREASSVEEFTPLMDRLRSMNDRVAAMAMLNILQTVRGVFEGRRDLLWAAVSLRAAEYLQPQFAWELAALTFGILGRAADGNQSLIVLACGAIGRRVLAWSLHLRSVAPTPFADNVGAVWAVPLVVRTISTDVEASRRLLDQVLANVRDPQTPIQYLSRLTSDLKYAFSVDPSFSIKVYEAAFSHEETSDEKTSFGTPILPLTSTRRQDFSMCQYHLIKDFSIFLDQDVLSAARAAVKALNAFIVDRQVVRFLKPGHSVEEVTERFTFRDRQSFYVRDLSYSWDASLHHDEAIKLADKLFARLSLAAQQRETGVMDDILNVLAEEARVAFWWKRLLENASRTSTVELTGRVFELAEAGPVLEHSETLHAVGMFIEECSIHLTQAQRESLEGHILRLPALAQEGKQRDAATKRRNRLLARIPTDLLCTDEARRLRTELEQRRALPSNEPLVSYSSSSGTYTESRWLQDQGADPEREDNKQLLAITTAFDAFSNQWRNARPEPSAVTALLPALAAGFETLRADTSTDRAVKSIAWTRITSAASTAARADIEPNGDAFSLLKLILLDGLRADDQDDDEIDEERDDSYTSASWSPSPTTEAADGLPWLGRLVRDEQILDSILALSRHPEPSVRYLVVRETFRLLTTAPDIFWRILEERSVVERNIVVQDSLCRALGDVIAREEVRAVAILDVVAPRIFGRDQDFEALDTLVSIVMWLTLERQNAWGRRYSDLLLDQPLDHSHALRQAVFRVVNYLTPSGVGSRHEQRQLASAAWLSRAIESAAQAMRRVGAEANGQFDEPRAELFKRLYDVSHEIVMRLQFAFRPRTEDVTDAQRAAFYWRVKPLIEQIISSVSRPETGATLFAPTAHHLMEFLQDAVEHDPAGALHMAADAAEASEGGGYHLDSMAAGETVQLAERIVTDYRSELRQPNVLADLIRLLDLFAKVGWPDALRLLWRLDEVFR